jgi:hypothetical protein
VEGRKTQTHERRPTVRGDAAGQHQGYVSEEETKSTRADNTSGRPRGSSRQCITHERRWKAEEDAVKANKPLPVGRSEALMRQTEALKVP